MCHDLQACFEPPIDSQKLCKTYCSQKVKTVIQKCGFRFMAENYEDDFFENPGCIFLWGRMPQHGKKWLGSKKLKTLHFSCINCIKRKKYYKTLILPELNLLGKIIKICLADQFNQLGLNLNFLEKKRTKPRIHHVTVLSCKALREMMYF